MKTKQTYSWEEEEKKLETLLYHYPFFFEDEPLEKLVRLLNRCLLLLQDIHEISEEEKPALLSALDTIEDFTRDLYRLHRAAKDEGFYLRELSQQLIANPYCRESKSEDELSEMRSKLFLHKVRHLRYEEVFNIYLFLDNLFAEYSILDWLDFISEWKKEISKERHILESVELCRPIWCYFQFHKVLETYYIIMMNCYRSHPNTSTEFHYNDNAIVYSDPACVINPFEYLDMLLYDTPISKIKQNVKTLFEYAHNHTAYQEDNPCRLIETQGRLNAIIETAYLITRSAYIPDEWLKPEKWIRPTNYIRPEIETIKPEFLSQKEEKKPYKTIKKELRNVSIMTGTVSDWVYNALDADKKEEDKYNYYSRFNKIVEAIYIIYYELLSKEQISGDTKEGI